MPWKDWNEWTEVKSLLYVGDDDQEAAKGLIEGLGMVDVWRARGVATSPARVFDANCCR